MKTYSPVGSEVERILDEMREQYHEELAGISIGLLFFFDDEDSSLPVLKHGGYGAQAVVRIVSLRDRAQGMPDAQIIIDRANWVGLSADQRAAVIDHELTHLEVRLNKETGEMDTDAIGRPKLKMRRHDHQIGVFTEVAVRHGRASAEYSMMRVALSGTGQLYWDFEAPTKSESNQQEARA